MSKCDIPEGLLQNNEEAFTFLRHVFSFEDHWHLEHPHVIIIIKIIMNDFVYVSLTCTY